MVKAWAFPIEICSHCAHSLRSHTDGLRSVFEAAEPPQKQISISFTPVGVKLCEAYKKSPQRLMWEENHEIKRASGN